MILIIGWRGEPGTKDGEREQHIMQGKVTGRLLDMMEIPYRIMSEATISEDISELVATAENTSAPVAFLVPNGVLTEKRKSTG